MTTPIYDFLKKYNDEGTLRLHMPGHKGKYPNEPFSSVCGYDITEIHGADSLFEASGIIAESEKNAACLFGTEKTVFSTQGSTLGIQTMLALAAKPGSTVVAPRNAHKAFVSACALFDLNVEWVIPDGEFGLVSFEYDAEDIEKAILRADKPSCVYITSPDYFGRIADVKNIAETCHRHNLPLLVDNAHGAHFAFFEENCHPIALGADMCCDSAHKTLPVLTGGAYLHIGNKKYTSFVKEKMTMLASSSPSYLTLCSLDLCNGYLAENIRAELAETVGRIESLKTALPFLSFVDGDPLHMTVEAYKAGLTGFEFAQALRENGIECEYADTDYTVMLFSASSTDEDFSRLKKAIETVKFPKIRIEKEKISALLPQKVMSIRAATLAENEKICVDNSAGRICGMTRVTCPPCIPVVVAGEKIEENCINILKKYSISEINVVK